MVRPSPKKPPIYCDFDEAKAKLISAIRRGPFYALLVGASGTGKTSLLRQVATNCDRGRQQVLYLMGSQTSSSGLSRYLQDVLHAPQRRSHAENLRSLAQTLRKLSGRLVLFLDDAHQLPESTLQEARFLAESDLEAGQLFSVLFSGVPDLKTMLDAQALFPLKRRISLRIELTGLKKDEVLAFLVARVDGAERLSDDVVSAIFERARGIPALIEKLAGLCLSTVPGKDAIPLSAVEEFMESWEGA